jgi:predicted N-acyltransferase
LHATAGYYQAIEFAIELGLSRVEAGAQGEHKLSRGYMPVFTRSGHYLRDPSFREAVSKSVVAEREQMYMMLTMLSTRQSPYKGDADHHLRSQGLRIEGSRIVVDESQAQ